MSNSTQQDLRAIPLDRLLPQRAPFLMINHLVAFDPVVTTTELEVRADNLFVEDGRLQACGLIENIAQTCAARMGYINLVSGRPVVLGFIGAVRGLTVHRTPAPGETLRTSITVREEIFQMTLVDAEIRSGSELIAEAEMKIALSDIHAQD